MYQSPNKLNMTLSNLHITYEMIVKPLPSQFVAEAPDDKYGTNRYVTNIGFPDLSTLTQPDWKVGIIYGPSGTGKSTILSRQFGFTSDDVTTLQGRPIDHVSEEILIAVSLMSIPAWYTDIRNLSGGEKERFRTACILSGAVNKQLVVLDEFTSLVDRATAKGMAKGISKWCRSHGKNLVVATIHNDIFSFMDPDFVWSTRYNKFITYVKSDIKIEYRAGCYSDWRLFKQYHYLSSNLFTASTITLALVDEEPVAFIAVSFQMGKTNQSGYMRRIHRLVVLPEWQGLGIGTKLLDHVAEIESVSNSLYIKTSHPAMGRHLELSHKWLPTTHNLKKNNNHPWYDGIRTTPCWCFKYNPSGLPPLTLNILKSPSIEVQTSNSPEQIERWDCLIRKGKVVPRGARYAYIRKNHPIQFFDTYDEALNAQYLSSVESGVNPYKIVGIDLVIKIKDTSAPGTFYYAKIPIEFLNIVKDITWAVRHMAGVKRARAKVAGTHVYLEDVCGIPRTQAGILFTYDPSHPQ